MNPLRGGIPAWMKVGLSSTLLTLTAMYVSANVAGPPPTHTGAPGEETCGAADCHTPPAVMPSTGFTISYESAGPDTVNILVTLSRAGSQNSLPFGFEVTVLDTADQPVGEIVLTDTVRTQAILEGNGRTYVSHTQAGVVGDICSNCEHWTFKWVRPATPVGWAIIYGAGCVGDGDSTAAGDVVQVQSKNVGAAGSCIVTTTGDINLSGTITSADIIGLLGYVFRGGLMPQPCVASGDVNCSGSVNTADIIYLVNFVFKSLQPPCDVCDLIPDVWPC